jgi:DNA mismatch repair protein MutS
VNRVRDAAAHLAEGRRAFVLFDEVFKGTNVRDALEASKTVILGFAKARGSGFIFSSHLVELVDALEREGRVQFYFFEGKLESGRATYSYELRAGVSRQRLGLQLLAEAEIPRLLARIGDVG